MKKNVQKLLSIVLTVIMMISMLPFSVFAADLDVYDVEEPAVEAVSVPAEEQEIESTVEDVLVGNAETEDELLVEDAEIVEDSSEEIETVDAADPAAAEDSVENSEEETAVEEVIPEEPAMVGVSETDFPMTIKSGSTVYTRYGEMKSIQVTINLSSADYTVNQQIAPLRNMNKPWTYYYYEYRNGNTKRYALAIDPLGTILEGNGQYYSDGKDRYIPSYGLRQVRPQEESGFFNDPINFEVVFTSDGFVSSSTSVGNDNLLNSSGTGLLQKDKLVFLWMTNQPHAGNGKVEYSLFSKVGNTPIVPVITHTIVYQDGITASGVTPFETVTYKGKDAAEGSPYPKYKDATTGEDTPSHPGYRFTGWIDQDNNFYKSSADVVDQKVTVDGDATYTAQWAPNSITVSKEVVVGGGVERKDIDQTIYYALWDTNAEDWFKKDGQIVYKTITITDGVPSGNAVFDENDLLESLDYSVSELKVASGTAVTELSVNDEFEVDGKTIKVSGIKAQELDAFGAVIKDNDNNTHLDTTNAAYVKFINTYTSDQTDSFELNKKWYDYQNGQRVEVTDTIQDVTATITLYRTIDGNTYEEVESKTLDGTEPTPWKAEFTNLNHKDDNGNVYTYAARETACTAGYKAYSTSSSEKPMPATEYKSSHQNIFNIQDAYGIYHSSNGTTEWFAVGEKIKLVDEVEPGYFYGGYYKYTETGNHKGPALDTYAKTGLDEDFTATENNTIYYLKEVPDTYLNPRIFITYDTNEGHTPKYALRQLWAIMDLDASCVDGDGNAYGEYGGYGFIIDDDIQIASSKEFICQTLEVNYPDKDKEEYTVKKMFNSGTDEDRLFVRDLTADYLTDTSASAFTLRAYFKTPDGLIVTGKKQRTVHLANRTFAADAAPSIQWKQEGDGIWQETATPGSEVAADTRSLGAFTTIPSVRTYKIKSTPDILTYTVTKVDDGKNESQVVQAGDNTGKITYAGKTGYVFAGWYLDKAYTKAADFSAVTGDMTVYAKYVKASAIGLSFTKKSSKSGSVTLNATLKITGAPDLADAAVSCDYKGKTSTVKFTGAKTTKSGKTTVSTYAGTVAISGLANKSSFTAAISYKTPDGTIVILADKTCKYTSGKVTVK